MWKNTLLVVENVIEDYLRYVTPKKVLAGAGEQVGGKMAELVGENLFSFLGLPFWLRFPLAKFSEMKAAKAGKKWSTTLLSHPVKQDSLPLDIDDFVLIEHTDIDEPTALDIAKMQIPESKWHGLLSHPLTLVHQIKQSTQDCVVTLTPVDAFKAAGGSLGATMAGGAFVVLVGPPGWVGLPLYLITEGVAMNFSRYLSHRVATECLGEKATAPFLPYYLSAFVHSDTAAVDSHTPTTPSPNRSDAWVWMK